MIKNVWEIAWPFIQKFIFTKWRLKWLMKNDFLNIQEQTLVEIEAQWWKPDYQYQEIDGSNEEYLELMIQFAYVIIFGAAFPLAPLLAFINNLIELRIDKYKLVYLTRWPVPHSAKGIGIWKMFIEIMIFIAIVTNTAYLTLTGTVVSSDISVFCFVTVFVLAIKIYLWFLIP